MSLLVVETALALLGFYYSSRVYRHAPVLVVDRLAVTAVTRLAVGADGVDLGLAFTLMNRSDGRFRLRGYGFLRVLRRDMVCLWHGVRFLSWMCV